MRTDRQAHRPWAGAVLAALVAGCCPGADGEARTAAQWLGALDDMVAKEQRAIEADEELADLAKGLHGYHWGQWWQHPASERRREALRAPTDRFRKWIAAAGAEIVEKWRKGEALTGAEKARLMIARQGYVLRPTYGELKLNGRFLNRPPTEAEKRCIAYVQSGRAVATRAHEVLRRAYSGRKLTLEDLNLLREYRMMFSPEFRPARIGFKTAYGNEWGADGQVSKWREGYDKIEWGKVRLPDFRLLKFESALKSPKYTDEFPRHWAWLSTCAIVRDYLRASQVYQMSKETGVVTIQPPPREDPWQADDYVPLRSLHRDKPLMIFTGDPEDCDFPRQVPVMAHIEKTYRGAVNFVFIPTDINEVRLSGAANYNYFSPRVEKEFDKGHELSPEEWARTVKLFYMTWPNASFPTLLDRSYMTMSYLRSYHIGAFLIDRDGRVVWRKPRQKHYDGNLLPGGEGAQDMITYDVVLERAILATLNNGGRFDPNFKPVDFSTPVWRFGEKEAKLKKQKQITTPAGFYLSKIVDLDRDAGEMLVRYAGVAKVLRRMEVLGRPIEYRVKVDEESEIRHLNVGGARIGLDQLHVGDRLERIRIWKYVDRPDGLFLRWATVKHNEANKKLPPPKRWGNSWLIGRITAIDGDMATVVVAKPVEAELIGYRFWKKALRPGSGQAGKRATMPENSTPASILAQLERWLGGDEAARTYHFRIDSQTFVYLNGQESGPDNMNVGDCVRVWYPLDDSTRGKTVVSAAAFLASRNRFVR